MAQKGLLTTADHLSYQEYLRLLDCLRQDKKYFWELYCILAFATGLRGSDVLSLKWEEILHKNYLIKLERKTQKARMIKISSSVVNRIGQLYKLLDKPDKTSPVIRNRKTKKGYSLWTINRKVKQFKYKYRLNIRAFSTHTFRKTFGRFVYDIWTDKSEALILLQEIFKHSDVRTTKRYIGLVQDDIDQVYDAIAV